MFSQAIVNKKEPKVLVIAANPFSDINNNGKTLKSIFSAFQKDSLCELYFRPQDNIIGDGTYADSYYAVCEMDIIRSIMALSKKCGSVQVFEKERDKTIAENKVYRSFLNGKLKNIKWLRSLLWKTRKWDTKEYRKWLDTCKPDVVFALLGGPGIMFTIAQEIAAERNIPLAVYFPDDYLLHWPKSSLLDRLKYKRDVKAFRRIIDYASIRFCIGEKMCKEYGSFFKKEFFPIMNCAAIKPFKYEETGNERPVISYFGSLWLDRWKMISRLADLMQDIGEINVYSANELNDEMKYAFNKPNIHFMGPVLGEEYDLALRKSDVLLHVESDDKLNRGKTALSISTKIPDCLASGKPIMAFGPTELASISLLKDNGIGFVLSSEDSQDSNREAIENYLNDPSLRRSYAEKGYDFAVLNFDKDKVSRKVYLQLLRIVADFKNKLK